MDTEFYNTTKESDQTVEELKAKNRVQDLIIYSIFKEKKGALLRRADIERILLWRGKKYPTASVVRSINTLTKKNLIMKTDEKREGDKGRMVYTWTLAGKPEQLQLQYHTTKKFIAGEELEIGDVVYIKDGKIYKAF